jgi:hypothetical protein
MTLERKRRLLFGSIMAFAMSLFMSFVMVAINVGFNDLFFLRWMKSWAIGFIAALPAVLLLAPQVNRLVNEILKNQS